MTMLVAPPPPRASRGWRRPLYAGSGIVAERGPGPGPRLPEPSGQVDRRALLVVTDPQAVVERGDLAHVAELAAQEGRSQADHDRGLVRRGRGPPQPEVVVAAVGLGQAQARAVPVDCPRLTVVAGQQRGPGPLRGGQRLVLAGDQRYLPGPRDRLGQVVVDGLQRD